jgi:hypothetical protein
MLEFDPQAVACGHLGEDTRPEDFARAGLQPDQMEEVEALLLLRPGDTHNFSSQEIERFATARAQLGSSRSPEAIREAVNEVLRAILFERMRAYREGGLDGIAPYARAGGRMLSPADELRWSSHSDSLFATEFRGLYEAFMGFPRIAHPDALHRFSWLERRSAEGPYFVLEHRMLARYAEFAVVAVRHFFATRHYDALSLTVGALVEGNETLVMATWYFDAERLTGLRGLVQRPGARRRLQEALVAHVTAIRAAVEADDVPAPEESGRLGY